MPSSIELVPLALAACDPIDSVGAVLVDPSGAPVAGAKVRFGCDGEVVVSDASGKFTHERIPSIPSACTIDVEKDGFVLHTQGMLRDDDELPQVRLEPVP